MTTEMPKHIQEMVAGISISEKPAGGTNMTTALNESVIDSPVAAQAGGRHDSERATQVTDVLSTVMSGQGRLNGAQLVATASQGRSGGMSI